MIQVIEVLLYLEIDFSTFFGRKRYFVTRFTLSSRIQRLDPRNNRNIVVQSSKCVLSARSLVYFGKNSLLVDVPLPVKGVDLYNVAVHITSFRGRPH